MTSPAVHIKVPVRQFGVPNVHSFVVIFELQFSKDSSLVQVSQLRQFTEKKKKRPSSVRMQGKISFLTSQRLHALRTKA